MTVSYITGSHAIKGGVQTLLIVIGTVIQDVVADAMSTEVVARVNDDGSPRPDADIRAELGMVQVLGRLALSAGILAVAGVSGWVASFMSREEVFLIGLIVPLISITGAFIRRKTPAERRALDWRILGGGLAFGATVIALALGGVPYAQEVTFTVSMAVICTMLVLVTRDIGADHQRAILFTSIIIFAFRATPSVGDGYFWFTLDVLKFDEAFYGVLRQTGAIIAIVVMWLFSRQLTEYSVTKTLFWIAVLGTILSLPNIGLVYGLADWTERMFGFGARSIAWIDDGGHLQVGPQSAGADPGKWKITQAILEREIGKARTAKEEHGGRRRGEKRVIGFGR